jgi:hypothetical protein
MAKAGTSSGWHHRARRGAVSARVVARRLDPRHHPLPDFVVIGAQRAGTTALYQHLSRHPDVDPPVRKEIQFLTLHWHRGPEWYRRNFPVLHDAQARTCEASPYYLFHPDAPARAAAALPATRFIAVLREPSARALSHHLHNRANGYEQLDFESALAAEDQRLADDPSGRHHRLYSYASRGLYAEQVRRWRHAVGDRLLVILNDDLLRDPRRTFDRVQVFVGLAPWEPDGFRAPPSPRAEAAAIGPAARRRLQERFAAPNRELAELLGRDLSRWVYPLPADHGPRAVPGTLSRSDDDRVPAG